MSRHKQRRGGRSTPRLARADAEAAAAVLALVAGCACPFMVRLTHDAAGPPALIGHEDGCPARNAPGGWIMVNERPDRGRHG